MKPVSEALEAWRQAIRDREATRPRTPEWLQAMMVEHDRRAAYQTAARDWGCTSHRLSTSQWAAEWN